ncbi:dynamin-1 [Parasteatoda tepidariorum]|uniref:dynamin-1 n=1 Tax=Parasteatoda tepidariorum TaxID=114398 RepID=UPI0039BCC9E9
MSDSNAEPSSSSEFFDASTGEEVEKKGTKQKGAIDLIDVANNLRTKLAACGHSLNNVSLPQIVVVGGQSSGKSSTVESFVARQFLPRGTGTVTRRPTIIQMTPNQHEEYVVFSHKPEVRFTDFKKVREEIETETRRYPGPTGFTSDPIIMQIYSPRVLKLTVVDLPGLIKNVPDGDDRSNIQEVRKMVLKYIEPKEALILAIIPATQDFLTCDSLEIAREADPKRERTIGVVTKLDRPNDGDYKSVLENRKIYLQKGYVGVVNRNDTEDEIDLEDILQNERAFFENHPAFKSLKHKMGIPYLIQMLQKTLRTHIQQFLPQLRTDISLKLVEHQKELKNFETRMGDSIGGGKPLGKQSYVIRLILNFIEEVDIQFMGNSPLIDPTKFSAGAKIKYKLNTEVKRNLSLTLVPDDTSTHMIIVNILGIRTGIAIPSLSLDAMNNILLQQYKVPMAQSVTCIKEVLKAAIAEVSKSLDRYSSLRNDVVYLIEAAIEKEADNCKEILLNHIDSNMYHINYHHPDADYTVCNNAAPPAGPVKLWENSTAIEEETVENTEGVAIGCTMPSTETLVAALKANESNQKNVHYASALLMKNLEPVQKQMEDVAMKYIIYNLVKKVLDFIKKDLLTTLLESTNFSKLIQDCEADFCWKEQTETTCRILQEALDAIQDF